MKKRMWLVAMLVCMLAGCANKTEETKNPEPEAEIAIVEEETIQAEAEVLTEEPEEESIDNLIMFDERKIHIPQLEQDYEIWFMSDSHIVVEDGSEDEQTKRYAAERKPGFAHESGLTSDVIFSQFIDRANKEMPDLILFGGDIIDFPSQANVEFLKSELDRLEVPYVMAYGNHDWTFPWEYMTSVGKDMYRPMISDILTGNLGIDAYQDSSIEVNHVFENDVYTVLDYADLQIISIDNSSNQAMAGTLEAVQSFIGEDKPVILMQHVPFSTEALIARAKEDWSSPVTLGMQVHGGIAPDAESKGLWDLTHDDESAIKAVLAGHVHFAYEEALSDSTVEIITDAGFKGKATRLLLQKNREHQYFCDKFTLTVDDKQFDLKEIDPEISSVSELYPIAGEQLYILGRVDENVNSLMVYDFTKEEFVFTEHGTTMCWVQDKFETVRYLKDNAVYDLEGNIIFHPEESNRISMIEYVVEDFKVTVVDENHENPQEIWIE